MDKINLSAPLETLFQVKGESMSMMKSPDFSSDIKESAVNMVQNSNMSLGMGMDFADMGINSVTVGDTTLNQAGHYAGYYWDFWQPYNQYYHSCYHHFTSPDKFETAFKLARKLMDKKLVKPLKTIEDFFKLMDSIVEAL